jgi:hypothetical protein
LQGIFVTRHAVSEAARDFTRLQKAELKSCAFAALPRFGSPLENARNIQPNSWMFWKRTAFLAPAFSLTLCCQHRLRFHLSAARVPPTASHLKYFASF